MTLASNEGTLFKPIILQNQKHSDSNGSNQSNNSSYNNHTNDAKVAYLKA